MKKCPHCKFELLAHGDVNIGFFHCNACGCCFDSSGELRDGVSICTPMQQQQTSVDLTALQDQLSKMQEQLETAVAENAKLQAELETAKQPVVATSATAAPAAKANG